MDSTSSTESGLASKPSRAPRIVAALLTTTITVGAAMMKMCVPEDHEVQRTGDGQCHKFIAEWVGCTPLRNGEYRKLRLRLMSCDGRFFHGVASVDGRGFVDATYERTAPDTIEGLFFLGEHTMGHIKHTLGSDGFLHGIVQIGSWVRTSLLKRVNGPLGTEDNFDPQICTALSQLEPAPHTVTSPAESQ